MKQSLEDGRPPEDDPRAEDGAGDEPAGDAPAGATGMHETLPLPKMRRGDVERLRHEPWDDIAGPAAVPPGHAGPTIRRADVEGLRHEPWDDIANDLSNDRASDERTRQ
jgi:hypothetical protein